MGFNGYEPYPGEEYLVIGASPRHNQDGVGTRVPNRGSDDRSLEERIEARIAPIFKELRRFRGIKEELHIIPSQNYQGIIDSFIDKDSFNDKDAYALLLDTEHERFDFWNSSVRVDGKGFSFTPTPEFEVHGTIGESGKRNGFNYYFVNVSKRKTR